MIIFLFQKDERQHQKTHPKQNHNGDDMKGKVFIVVSNSFLQLEKPMRIVITIGRIIRIISFWDVEVYVVRVPRK